MYETSYLVHHGINGQKWGKKNGPPYPLSASSHSSAEKKAGTKGWTSEAKSMSDDDLRKAINRKKLENEYRSYEVKTGKNKAANDAIKSVKRGVKTTSKVYNAGSKGYELSGDDEKRSRARLKKDIADTTANAFPDKDINFINEDLSSLKDEEIRTKIDRLALESEYDNLYNSNKGKEYVDQALDLVDGVADLAITGLTVALLIKKLKSKG